MATTQTMSVCLWFDRQAEDAAKYYCSIFKNSRIISTARFGKEGNEIHHQPDGLVLTVDFELNGSRYCALNGGPDFKFNEAVSIMVNCDTQKEIDYYWEKLGAGGDPKAQQCGWLKDKFGLSWQIVPKSMTEMMDGAPNEKTERLTKAMMKMKKLDIDKLKIAYEGRELVES